LNIGKVPGFHPVLKIVLFWVIFMPLYFTYRTFPIFPLSLICLANESNFQHYKSTFFTCLTLSIIEYFVYPRQIQGRKSYLFIYSNASLRAFCAKQSPVSSLPAVCFVAAARLLAMTDLFAWPTKCERLSRLTATIFAPWVVFLLWYTAPAVYGKMPTIPLEIMYANIITLLVGYFATSLEQGLVQIRYTSKLSILILVLFTVSIFYISASRSSFQG
jgi:hypothetical protein